MSNELMATLVKEKMTKDKLSFRKAGDQVGVVGRRSIGHVLVRLDVSSGCGRGIAAIIYFGAM